MPFRTILLSAALVCQVLITTASSAEALTDSKWFTIQVSSSRETEDADRQVAALKAHGLDAVSSYETVEGKGMWHRVYVGRFGTKQEAETVASEMKSGGIISGYWVKELKDTNILPVTSEPDRTLQAVVEKEEAQKPEGQRIDSGKPSEPRVSTEEKVEVESPQLPAEVKGAGTTAPSVDIVDKPVVEEALIRPPAPESGIEEKYLEPQIGVQEQAKAQPPRIPAEEKGTAIVASSEDVADRPIVKETSVRAPATEQKVDDRSPFSIGMRIGGVYLPSLDKFTVSTSDMVWYFENKFMISTLVPSYSLNKSFSLDGSIEKIMNAEFDFLYATLGPKWRFFTSNSKDLFNLSPYIRGAVAWSDMRWDDIPGNFDSSIGGEIGTGLDIITFRSRLRLGLEMSYRSIKFNYNIPSGQDVIFSREQIDFSGYSFTGFLNYNF